VRDRMVVGFITDINESGHDIFSVACTIIGL